MPDNELQKSLPGFDKPIALLRTCHEKIRLHCQLLEDLVDHIDKKGIDGEAQSTARKIRDYFTKSAKLHHQDEENDLFPLLVRQSLKISDLVSSLEKEHNQLNVLWENIDHGLSKLDNIDIGIFGQQVNDICTLYRQHIAQEESDFFPLAQHSLSQKQLLEIGRGMAKRRDVRISF